MTDILLTNDDGFNSAGFYPLLEELSKKYRVIAVAPSEEKSWVGKAITAHQTLNISRAKVGEFEVYTVDGTPADCVQIGLYEVLDTKPRMVVSGINTGPNTGHGRILSSGTVGAAMEAAIDGIAAVSSSLSFTSDQYKSTDFHDAANYYLFEQAVLITARIVDLAFDNELDDSVDILSLNIPYGVTSDTEIQVTVPHRAPYGRLFQTKGRQVRHVSPPLANDNLIDGTDLKALADGKVSLTPLNLDLVSHSSMKQLRELLRPKNRGD
jgi:5'-nucleotidase